MKQVSRPYKHSVVFTAHIKQGWLLCWDWIISKVTYSPKILKPSHRSIISTHVCGSEGTVGLLSASFLGDRMKRSRKKQVVLLTTGMHFRSFIRPTCYKCDCYHWRFCSLYSCGPLHIKTVKRKLLGRDYVNWFYQIPRLKSSICLNVDWGESSWCL